jgi:hypothetical protein
MLLELQALYRLHSHVYRPPSTSPAGYIMYIKMGDLLGKSMFTYISYQTLS